MNIWEQGGNNQRIYSHRNVINSAVMKHMGLWVDCVIKSVVQLWVIALHSEVIYIQVDLPFDSGSHSTNDPFCVTFSCFKLCREKDLTVRWNHFAYFRCKLSGWDFLWSFNVLGGFFILHCLYTLWQVKTQRKRIVLSSQDLKYK